METIKIDFQDFWEGFDKEKNYFIDTLRETYDVVISNKPDFMFYSVFPDVKKIKIDVSSKGDFIRKVSPKLYVFMKGIYSSIANRKMEINHPQGNFVKIFFDTEGVIPDMTKCDYAFSTYPKEIVNHKNYLRIPLHIICDYPIHNQIRIPFERNINFEQIKKEKTKFCNFIYSQDINKRNDFFKELSKYKSIDAPGRCMNNMEAISNEDPRSSRVSNDWVKTKLEFLKPYKFTIAFENVVRDGWTTEKLTHPFLVNSIPIYVGNEKVGKDFNTKSFINYHDFDSMKEFIEHIKKVDTNDDLWRKYLEQPIFKTKEQYDFDSHERIKNKLNEIIEKHIR